MWSSRFSAADVEASASPETPEHLEGAPEEVAQRTGVSVAKRGATTTTAGHARWTQINPIAKTPVLPNAVLARKVVMMNSHKAALNPKMQEAILLQIFRITREDAMLRRMLEIAEFKPNNVFAIFALRLAQSARWDLDKPNHVDVFGVGQLNMNAFRFVKNKCLPKDAYGLSTICANSLLEMREINRAKMAEATESVARPNLTSTLVSVADLCCNPKRQESTVIMAALAFPKQWRTVVQGNVYISHPGETNGLWQLFRTEFCDVTIQTVGRIDELITELRSETVMSGVARSIWFRDYRTIHAQVAQTLVELKRLILHINTLAEKNTRVVVNLQRKMRQQANEDVD